MARDLKIVDGELIDKHGTVFATIVLAPELAEPAETEPETAEKSVRKKKGKRNEKVDTD